MKKVGLAALLFFVGLFIIWTFIFFLTNVQQTSREATPVSNQPGIQPSADHPSYWSYNDKEFVLLGGSVEDNLFQIDGLESQLDLLKACGGNYVRNTMSSRDPGNVWPFYMKEDSIYDLDRWNDLYWLRFENFLQATHDREIVVQIEIWATFDFYRDNWEVNPFNPKNNINYSKERTHLPLEVKTHPIYTENNFFRSVPAVEHNIKVLEYQQKFVDKLLSHSLKYDHVLYCMDNETSVTAEWGKFWSDYIRKKAREMDKTVHTTEMWDPWDLNHITHRETFDHPELYTFVDISQNNHNAGDRHWENGLSQLARLQRMNAVRPVNNVKIYGNDGGRHQTTRNGIECFVRNVLMGCASARFHRPTSGQGLNETAQAVIKSMRMYIEEVDFMQGAPANGLLLEREAGEAYCRAWPGKEYAIYFTDGGSVEMDIDAIEGTATVAWLEILESKWTEPVDIKPEEKFVLTCPDQGHWLALIRK